MFAEKSKQKIHIQGNYTKPSIILSGKPNLEGIMLSRK